MNVMVRLRAEAQDRLESFGKKTEDDYRYFDFAADFDRRLMDLEVSLSIDDALDTGWEILAGFFKADEVRVRRELIDKYGKW